MAPVETTVDPADIRGLVTARPWIVSELPLSSDGRGDEALPGNGFPRVLRTVAAPPAIPSESSVFVVVGVVPSKFEGSAGSSVESAVGAGDRPDEAAELARDGGHDDLVRLAACGETSITGGEPESRLPGDGADRCGQPFAPVQQASADTRRMSSRVRARSRIASSSGSGT